MFLKLMLEIFECRCQELHLGDDKGSLPPAAAACGDEWRGIHCLKKSKLDVQI